MLAKPKNITNISNIQFGAALFYIRKNVPPKIAAEQGVSYHGRFEYLSYQPEIPKLDGRSVGCTR